MTHVLALNCTLKKSPETSNTRALLDIVLGHMEDLGASASVIRVVDHHIPTGITSDEGEDDDWPGILEKVEAADVLILATPLWFGHRSSVAQLVIERLDGTYNEADDETGRFPLYNKAAGVVVTGNEDGAHCAAESILFNLSHLGCMIPPNADCYWVGPAGPGPSFIEAHGDKHAYTLKTARWMAHNLMHAAHMLQRDPFTTNLRRLTEAANAEASNH